MKTAGGHTSAGRSAYMPRKESLQEGAHQADHPGHADDDQQDLAEGLLRDALGHGEGQQRAQSDGDVQVQAIAGEDALALFETFTENRTSTN